MQAQSAEAFCLSLRLGRINMVSMPAEYLPRRIDWTRWIDGVTAASRVHNDRVVSSPRICLSPDHQDPKDNIAISSVQGQSGLDHVDFLKMFSDVGDGTRFLFVGSWTKPIPSWFSSIQSVFNAQYGSMIPETVTRQMTKWTHCADKLEKNGSFLVSDDLGRLSALTSISRTWRARQIRGGAMVEARAPAWFAAMFDVYMPKSPNGALLRLHKLLVVEPENWCGAPKMHSDVVAVAQSLDQSAEIWISAPSIGLSLWIADQQHNLQECINKLRMPGAILGWHPLRDLVAFLAEAPSGSLLYLVDDNARLQVLKKEQGDTP